MRNKVVWLIDRADDALALLYWNARVLLRAARCRIDRERMGA